MIVKNISIDTIGLSVRSMNALHRIEVHTVGDMMLYDEEKLHNVRNLGQKSIQEILEKIELYKEMEASGGVSVNSEPEEITENIEDWQQSESGKTQILQWLKNHQIGIDVLELLSAKAYNLLLINEQEYLYQIAFKTKDELQHIPRMDEVSAAEIVRRADSFIRERLTDIFEELNKKNNQHALTLNEMRFMPEYRESIGEFVCRNDIFVDMTNLPSRARNCLHREGFHKLSDIIFLTDAEIKRIPSMLRT